jgi:hypothetical protein
LEPAIRAVPPLKTPAVRLLPFDQRRSELEARQPAPPRFTSPPPFCPANKKSPYFRFLPFSLIAVHAKHRFTGLRATRQGISAKISKKHQ